MGLIGAYPTGIGYGNISARSKGGFVISGSGGGIHGKASAAHFTQVTGYAIGANTVHCRGPVKASSESLTQATVYETAPAVTAFVHAHHKGIWDSLLGKVHKTAPRVRCGTAAMAMEIARLFRETDVERLKFLLMRGHEGGLFGFGGSLREASLILLGLLRKTRN